MSLVARIICWIVWGLLLFSNGLYLITGPMLLQESAPAPWSDFADLMLKISIVNVGIALLIFAGARLLIHFVRNPKARPFIANGALPLLALFAWILCQACSIYGLIIFFQTSQLRHLYLFMGIGISGLLLLNPYLFYRRIRQNEYS